MWTVVLRASRLQAPQVEDAARRPSLPMPVFVKKLISPRSMVMICYDWVIIKGIGGVISSAPLKLGMSRIFGTTSTPTPVARRVWAHALSTSFDAKPSRSFKLQVRKHHLYEGKMEVPQNDPPRLSLHHWALRGPQFAKS